MLTISLLINPVAGVGGSIAAKGSDNLSLQQALSAGAEPRAQQRVTRFLAHLKSVLNDCVQEKLTFLVEDRIGASLVSNFGFQFTVIHSWPAITNAEDSKAFLRAAQSYQPDMLVFAGGDGTARDVVDFVAERLPVLGLPSGVKMHSGCFAISPEAAAEVLAECLSGGMLSLKTEEVRDIDEQALNSGKVKSRYYGQLKVPDSLQYMQHTKVGGVECDSLILNEIAEWFGENIVSDVCYFLGAGTTVNAIKQQLNSCCEPDSQLQPTLLGVDCFYQDKFIQLDCNEGDLLNFLNMNKCHIVVSPTGGQGHLFGRGNQQFSPAVLSHSNMRHIHIVSSKAKIKSLQGRPLLIDTNDVQLDSYLSGLRTITTGWDDQVIYPASAVY